MTKGELTQLIRQVVQEELINEKHLQHSALKEENLSLKSVILYASYQGDSETDVGSIYSVSKDEDTAYTKWYRDTGYFHRIGPDDYTHLYLVRVECTKAEASTILKSVKRNSTWDDRRAGEAALAQLVEAGKTEELEIEYGGD